MDSKNIALMTELTHDSSKVSSILANFKAYQVYKISFEATGDIRLELTHRDVTGKLIGRVNGESALIKGSYSFPYFSLQDGFLRYRIVGKEAAIINIKITEGVD